MGKVERGDNDRLPYGGQAVLEGVMMRGKRHFAVACRRPDGSIALQQEAISSGIMGRLQWLNKPLLRGSLALIDAMALGGKALSYSSHVQLEGISSDGKSSTKPGSKSGNIGDIAIAGTLVLSLLFALFVFNLLPTFITQELQHFHLLGSNDKPFFLNLMDGFIRIVMFFGYILSISRMENIRRVFMYHGAEHKAINTLEAGRPLTVESAMTSSRIHPRCGTSFVIVVLIIDLLVVALLPRPASLLLRFTLQAAVLPFVAGVAYELIRIAGYYRHIPAVRLIFAPGMATQYLTTREPDASQVEVALTALRSVLEVEGHEDWFGGPITTEPIAAVS